MLQHRRQYLMLAVTMTVTALLASACSSDAASSSSASTAATESTAPIVTTPATPVASMAVSSGSIKTGGSSLSGSSWQLTSFVSSNGKPTKATSSPSAGTLVFATGGKVSGSTGCNTFNGTYKQSGSALTITVGPMTMMACTGAVATQETDVLANLALVDSFASGARLQLKMGTTTILTYKADASGLEGSSWVATGINNGKGGVVSDANTAKVTAKFNTDGSVSGSGGCNTYTASFTTSGTNGLKIGTAASTMMAC